MQEDNAAMKAAIDQLQGFMRGMQNVPKWIEEIPGKRSPYFAVIVLNFAADSTARQDGVHNISTDGPFVCTGLALFFQKTSGAYQGVWGPATAFGSKIAFTGQQHGYGYLFDQPNCSSYTVEVTDEGSNRMWQNLPVASGLYSPQAGGAYILPASHLFGRNSTIRLAMTPDVSMPYTSRVQGVFLGYKIVQGAVFQP
jgi:hypothetical protein